MRVRYTGIVVQMGGANADEGTIDCCAPNARQNNTSLRKYAHVYAHTRAHKHKHKHGHKWSLPGMMSW
jgi:hypothetical protein